MLQFCPHCGKEVLATDLYCLNCGQNLGSPTGSQVPYSQPTSYAQPHTQRVSHSKSPVAAALLNFFFPGVGYAYTGLGRDTSEVIFGALVFVFFFLGFEVGVVGDAFTTTVTSTAPPSAFAPLLLLVFLLPFAFAYDGYHRAKSA